MKRSKILCAMILAAAVTWYVCNHLAVSLTPSLDRRVFWREPAGSRIITEGIYVTFDQVVPNGRNVRELKQVACAPGHFLTVDDNDDSFCEGRYLGHAQRQTLSGAPLQLFRYKGRVPHDQLFIMGTHVNSFDSRYFGFVDRSRIKEVAWSVF